MVKRTRPAFVSRRPNREILCGWCRRGELGYLVPSPIDAIGGVVAVNFYIVMADDIVYDAQAGLFRPSKRAARRLSLGKPARRLPVSQDFNYGPPDPEAVPDGELPILTYAQFHDHGEVMAETGDIWPATTPATVLCSRCGRQNVLTAGLAFNDS